MPVSRDINVKTSVICCFFAIVHLIVHDTSGLPYAKQLYEGSQCTMENGTAGICKKLPDCPPRIADVRAGRRTTEAKGRCGFENFVEIVCCPLSVPTKIGSRAADAACHEYENEVTSTSQDGLERSGTDDEGLIFHILGGTRAASGEFPYMAALGYENTDSEVDDPIVYSCGGTLISSLYVLTAAHCISNINRRIPVRVKVGSEDLKSTSADAQEIPVSRVIAHPQYKRSINYNDIGLVNLAKPARMSNMVKPICLETKSLPDLDIDDDTSFVVIGFGTTDIGAASSDKLMKTGNLSLVAPNVCGASYVGFARLPSGVDDNMICAIDDNAANRSDSCHGDSGGPLLMISRTGQSVIGVTAFGQTCGGPDPAVYMSVYSYLDWIESHVWPEQTEA